MPIHLCAEKNKNKIKLTDNQCNVSIIKIISIGYGTK